MKQGKENTIIFFEKTITKKLKENEKPNKEKKNL
jgi:hypothetical protein